MKKVGLPVLVLAGLCGGMAEVVWVALYGAVTGLNGVEVARQVTASVFPAFADQSLAPALGVAIHFALSVALAIAFGLIIWRRIALGRIAGMAVGVAVLCLIWAMNFFVVLLVLNPAFVALMPYAITLLSKALFGVAMVGMLEAAESHSTVRPPVQLGY